ncbi:hypothetical protein PR048_015735 [Dryococelus australis]|uniref:Uncharacterized protein n=1 Tax=Dryococelus australis TaxID=614101 RepID=A0ABQ9HHY2_9NEOP|nr:hypothetical protein PR048_015735 [Dryococelus australis]
MQELNPPAETFVITRPPQQQANLPLHYLNLRNKENSGSYPNKDTICRPAYMAARDDPDKHHQTRQCVTLPFRNSSIGCARSRFRSRSGVAVRLLAYQFNELGSVPNGSVPNFRMWGSCRTMLLDGWWVFSGTTRFLHSFILVLIHTHLTSPPSALKTSIRKFGDNSKPDIWRRNELIRPLKKRKFADGLLLKGQHSDGKHSLETRGPYLKKVRLV